MSSEPTPTTSGPGEPGELTELLVRAEAILAERAARLPPPDRDETTRIVHQLAVHQIELDLQEQELRQARDRLTESLAAYVDLYDFAPAGYVTLDAAGAVTQLNLVAAELLGMDRAVALGTSFVDAMSTEDRVGFGQLMEQVATNHGEHSCEVRLLRRDAPSATVVVEARRVSGGDQVRLAMVDVTELRAAQLAAAQLAVVGEREQIARMLHDTVQQRLFGLSSSLQALQMRRDLADEVKVRIEALVGDVESTIVSIRQTIFEPGRGWVLGDRPGGGVT